MQERPLTTINQAGEDSAPVFEVEEPTDGQVLAYDGDSGKWKNADAGGGSGGGVLVVTVTETPGDSETTYTMDKTWQEISGAIANGPVQVIYSPSEDTVYVGFIGEVIVDSNDGFYGVDVLSNPGSIPTGDDGYFTDTPTGYPSYTEEQSN